MFLNSMVYTDRSAHPHNFIKASMVPHSNVQRIYEIIFTQEQRGINQNQQECNINELVLQLFYDFIYGRRDPGISKKVLNISKLNGCSRTYQEHPTMFDDEQEPCRPFIRTEKESQSLLFPGVFRSVF